MPRCRACEPGCCCDCRNLTEFAVGHRMLIDGSEGSARTGHGATSVDCVGLGASVAVCDSRFAAGAGGREHGTGPESGPDANLS